MLKTRFPTSTKIHFLLVLHIPIAPLPNLSNNKMKHNNNKTPFTNLSLLSTIILICFSLLGQCNATFPRLHHHRYAYPPEASHQPYSDTPIHDDASSPTPSQHHGHGKGHGPSSSSSSFSFSFSDILKGTLRGHTLTMPEHVINSQNQHNHALKQICGHTDYPDVCLSAITPHLNDHNFDLTNVLQASIKACSQQIKLTMEKVSKHSSSMWSENMHASLFADCREQYSNALENLKRASDAIPSRDLGTATIMLSAVVADVSTCESGFEDLKSSSFKVDSDGLAGIMASNCLAIAHLIPH